MDQRKQGADDHVAENHVEEQFLVGPTGSVAASPKIRVPGVLQPGIEVVAGTAVAGQDFRLCWFHAVPCAPYTWILLILDVAADLVSGARVRFRFSGLGVQLGDGFPEGKELGDLGIEFPQTLA